MNKNPIILVVDDEPVLTEALSMIIKTNLKWDVIESNSPLKALEILKKHKRWFGLGKNGIDCIIVDLKMPELNGFEFIKKWRDIEGQTEIPVIILSAYEDEKKWVQSTETNLGLVTAYLKKPIRQSLLIETLKRIVIRNEIATMQEELHAKSYSRYYELKNEIEHKIAHDMQKSLLPETPTEFKRLTIHTLFKPAAHVGGDYYDFFKLSSTRLGVILVDVIGSGIPACMLMVRIRELVHRYNDSVQSPKVFLECINNVIAEDPTFKKGFPIFYGIVDTESKTFTYVNTIGNAGAIHGSSGQTNILEEGGFMVGAMPNEVFEEGVISLKKGDFIICFTDGITEQTNGTEEQFGMERLLATISTLSPSQTAALPELLYREVETFMGSSPQDDDTTIVSIRID